MPFHAFIFSVLFSQLGKQNPEINAKITELGVDFSLYYFSYYLFILDQQTHYDWQAKMFRLVCAHINHFKFSKTDEHYKTN